VSWAAAGAAIAHTGLHMVTPRCSSPGDLSAKFGPLNGTKVQSKWVDPTLTLYGFNRYVGCTHPASIAEEPRGLTGPVCVFVGGCCAASWVAAW
jgi:hypothetical protein